ncbi:MAG: DUF2460 domain-containing protein [Stellaceae bacterium]
MGTTVFPWPTGWSYTVQRTPIFATRKQKSISGKVTRIADQSIPVYQWTLPINLLRQAMVAGTSYDEFFTFEGFFDSLYGGWDTFLFQDLLDYTITSQPIGTGDGTTTIFPMVRALGGFAMPILAPNLTATLNVYVNGSLQSPSGYTVTPWGTSNAAGPGQLIFNTAPGAYSITADFSWYFPCTFDDDKMSFAQFMQNLIEVKKISFTSVK